MLPHVIHYINWLDLEHIAVLSSGAKHVL